MRIELSTMNERQVQRRYERQINPKTLKDRPSLVLRTAAAYSLINNYIKNTEKNNSIGSAGDLINQGSSSDMIRHRMGIFYGRQ